MAIDMDTEDRMERGLDSLEAVTELCCGQTTRGAVSANNLAQLLSLIHTELRTAWPGALSKRMGDND